MSLDAHIVGTDGDVVGVEAGRLLTKSIAEHGKLSLARGAVPGISCIRKFGRNTAVGGTNEEIWSSGGPYTGWLQAAETLRVKAGGAAADTLGGVGAQSINFSGLDEDWRPLSRSVNTLGALVSLETDKKFIRLFRASVDGAGAYGGNNTAAVNIETSGGTLIGLIGAALGQTQMAIYCIPADTYGFLSRLKIVNETTTTKSVNAQMWRRERADVVTAGSLFGPKRLVKAVDELLGEDLDVYECMPFFPPKTDVWVSALKSGGGADPSVNAQFDIFLVNKSLVGG